VSKRLEFLQKMTSAPNADPFAWYGLAMEFRSLGRLEECLRTFETLRQRDPGYVAMYLMAAQVLSELQRKDEARSWAEEGIQQGRRKGDTHAIGELESLLAGL
jgi:predicted Zn-dependent protease